LPDEAKNRRPRIAGLDENHFSEPNLPCSKENWTMLRLTGAFLILALVAALFGFGSVFSHSWDGARILFFIFTVLAVLSFVVGAYRWRTYLN
jgi:uncharacterized membrane protein YtjA (UPF0391 family)